jgi:hypothetical protein
MMAWGCAVLTSVYAVNPVDNYAPTLRGVEASSVCDAAFTSPENVTDWNWT